MTTMGADITVTCEDCHKKFVWTIEEQQFYEDKGFSRPKRCRECRKARKVARQQESA